MALTPRFKHPHCTDCRLIHQTNKWDIYFCNGWPSYNASILLRKSSEPSDYWSMSLDVIKTAKDLTSEEFKMAKRIANSDSGIYEFRYVDSVPGPNDDGSYVLLQDVVPELLAWSTTELADGRSIGVGRSKIGVVALHIPQFEVKSDA